MGYQLQFVKIKLESFNKTFIFPKNYLVLSLKHFLMKFCFSYGFLSIFLKIFKFRKCFDNIILLKCNSICNLNFKLIFLQLKCWHTIRFLVNFKLINTDLRLLNREFIFFISTFSNTLNFIKQLFFSVKKKTLSVLRSPFIYNKSYEQFQIMWFKISVKSYYRFNLLLYSYFQV